MQQIGIFIAFADAQQTHANIIRLNNGRLNPNIYFSNTSRLCVCACVCMCLNERRHHPLFICSDYFLFFWAECTNDARVCERKRIQAFH